MASKKFKKIFISLGACKWEEFNNILKMDIDLKKFILCTVFPLTL